MRPELAEAARILGRARRVVVLTGAGVSAESGVPTFRGEQGLWKTYRPEQLATPQAFSGNPELVWEWYQHRQSVVSSCAPNPAHHALAELEGRPGSITLITQNVDGLHRRAGSENVLELHGNIFRARCTREGGVRQFEGKLKCECGAWLRPHIVWFGEQLDPVILEGAFSAARRAEVFLAVGTSSLVAPANLLAGMAAQAGATVIEVNLAPTPLTVEADFFLQGPAGEVLPRLLAKDPPP
ncbi:NAD-dependent deacylase [bacterium CPR1]|nr:NAD-dependent deacylase [bacterium CPR1]